MRTLNVHSLKKRLNCICSCLHSLYKVNYGGCCYIAYLIALHLDKLGVKYKLIIYDDIQKDCEEIEHEVTCMAKNKLLNNSVIGENCCGHYSILIEGAGVINPATARKYYTYTIEDINARNIKWIYSNSEWNQTYKTKYNMTVKAMLDSFFRDYY